MNLTELDTALNALGTSLDDEVMTVTVGGRDINLMVDTAKEYLYAYAALRKLEASVESTALRALLELNTLGKATNGGQIGLVEAGAILLYSKRYRIETLTREILEADVKRVAQTVTKLSGQIDKLLGITEVIEPIQPVQEKPVYDALSSTAAVSRDWIKV